MIPCSGIIIIVLTPTSSCKVCTLAFPFQSQNLTVPSFAQLTITYLVYWRIRVIWDVCSLGKLRIKFPVVISQIFIVLSKPPLKRVVLSCNRHIVQMKSKCPVIVLRHADEYFFVKDHTLTVLSELPDISVFPVDVHYIHKTSLICPLKFLMF